MRFGGGGWSRGFIVKSWGLVEVCGVRGFGSEVGCTREGGGACSGCTEVFGMEDADGRVLFFRREYGSVLLRDFREVRERDFYYLFG